MHIYTEVHKPTSTQRPKNVNYLPLPFSTLFSGNRSLTEPGVRPESPADTPVSLTQSARVTGAHSNVGLFMWVMRI